MAEFVSFDGTRLAYEVEGEGTPVILLHGFASDSARNWVRPKIKPSLVGAGYRTITLDARGHGESGKPHEVERYAGSAMRRDAQALLGDLGVHECFALGYSMGARIVLGLLLNDSRIRAAAVGGIGAHLFQPRSNQDQIADALIADDPSSFPPSPRAFRSFADATGADRNALAAAMRAGSEGFSPEELASITVPTLVICGDRDTLAGSPKDLAAALGAASAVVVSGDHLNALFDPLFSKSVIEFFDQQRG